MQYSAAPSSSGDGDRHESNGPVSTAPSRALECSFAFHHKDCPPGLSAGSQHSAGDVDDSFLGSESLSSTDADSASEQSESDPHLDESACVEQSEENVAALRSLRFTYLLVTLVIMLADGLQGTHLYVLYESYGFSVATLYCLGFATGGVLSPLTGPLVDHMGRKKAALLYCGLEMFINLLEQYPFYIGLVASRMIGGFTTNLLSTVFETWLDTEYRRRGLARENYELVMRDSVIISNLAAIFSGYLSHVLAETYGVVGPFRGAVTCTAIAFVVVLCVWNENYGCSASQVATEDSEGEQTSKLAQQKPLKAHYLGQEMISFFREAVWAFWQDSKMLRVGVTQGFTAGSLQIFVFLWVPALRNFALSAPEGSIGLDKAGEPAYGLIFGAYMAAGVLGGFIAPPLRRWVTTIVTREDVDDDDDDLPVATVEVDGEGVVAVRPMAVELLASTCYVIAAVLLFVPCVAPDTHPHAFAISLVAFLTYEMIIGIFLPCEGVIRSLYFPTNARASIMALPRVIVNFAVALGVVSTNFVSLKTAFGVVSSLMMISAILQLSLVSKRDWSRLFSQIANLGNSFVRTPVKRVSFQIRDAIPNLRRLSTVSILSDYSDNVSSSQKKRQ